MRKMQCLAVILSRVWCCPDTTVLRIHFTMQWRVGFSHPHDVQQSLLVTFHCASAHVAKFCLAPESISNNWWSAWILHGCRSNIPCRMRRIDGSGIPTFLSVSRALILPVDVLVTKSWHFVPQGHGPLLRLVCHFVDNSPNSRFFQNVVLYWISHSMK